MKIKKLITINWANLENREFLLDDLVFLTGQTGVGKSTFLDAIQTVLTGAMDNVVNYNAGQDENERKTHGKEFRSLGGYVLGEDRELYSRPSGAIGTIVLTFVSTKNEKQHIFNAIVNIKSSLEEIGKRRKATVDETHFFVVKGSEIFKEDILDGDKVLIGDELYNSLEKNSKFNKENISRESRKSYYLGILYGQLWGVEKVPPDRAKKAAKALARFIYARPVENLNNFVRDEFLEDKNMNIEITKLSDALTTLQEIKEQSEIIQYGISELEKFTSSIDNLLTTWKNNSYSHFLYSINLLNIAKKEKKEFYEKIEKDDERISLYSKKIEKIKYKLTECDESLFPLISKRDNSEAFQNIENIKKELLSCQDNISNVKINLIQYANKIVTNVFNEIYTLSKSNLNISFINQFESLFKKIESFSKIKITELLPFNISVTSQIKEDNFRNNYDLIFEPLLDIEKLFKSIVHNLNNSEEINLFMEEFNNIQQNEKELKKSVESLNEKIERLEKNKIICPDKIQNQFNLLQELFHEIPMSMLYQHIDIEEGNKEWAYSIEGFLKNNRFAIVVPVGYELVVINSIKNKGLNQLKIIQSTKMLDDIEKIGRSVKENSIINKLSIDNEIVEAYLIKNYKNVLCYEREEDLKIAERGILKENKAVNGGLMFYCKAEELFFGENAKQQMLLNLKERLSIEESILDKTSEKLSNYRTIHKIISYSIPNIRFEADTLINNFEDNYSKYCRNSELLEGLNTKDFQELNSKIQKLQEQKEKYDEERIALSADLKNLNLLVGTRESNLKLLENKLGKAYENYNLKKENFSKIMSYIKPSFVIEEFDINSDILESEPVELNVAISNDWNTFISLYIKSKIFAYKEIYYYENSEITEIKANINSFEKLFSENKKMLEELSRLKGSLQIKYKREIEEGEQKVKEVFMEGFCVTMYRNIKNCKLEIEKFSTMLSKHKFENDQFIMVTLDADPEYESYKKLFTTIAENGNLFGISNKDELEEVKNGLLKKFLNLGENKNELLRIADYRNYSKYDIIQKDENREVSLSRSGKNSGGQGETSYYIIRSINLHSALNPSLKKGSTLETILIDESFIKTNDDRAKEIINYLNKTLGFQVITALPTKGANELLKMDCSNYNITKLPIKNAKKGELDYVAWARYINNNAEAINRCIEAEQPSLFEAATIEGKEEYERITSI